MNNEMMDTVRNFLAHYHYDQYCFYPSKKSDGWEKYFLSRLNKLFENDEWLFFYNESHNIPYLLGCYISKWDYNIFGFKMAFIHVLVSGNTSESEKIVSSLLKDCLKKLYDDGVKFVSTRINGDNLPAIHAFESFGFKYYENIIRPVAHCENVDYIKDTNVRFMVESELTSVMNIASKNTFQRGHYYCDNKFDTQKINLMYRKWVQSAWESNDLIAVIEVEDQIGGFFIHNVDKILSEKMGYKYGQMKNLVIDSNFRESGLGEKLWVGTIALMKKAGSIYIDSGYSSKNYISSKLHTKYLFYPVCEEVVFHLWF